MDAAGAADAGAGVHQLERAWCLWETRVLPGKSRFDYLDKNKKAFTFSSVEEFWQYWNNYPKPSKIMSNGRDKKMIVYEDGNHELEALCMFVEGVKPAWEDPANESGAELRVSIPRTSPNLDKIWDTMVMTAIGETLEEDGVQLTGLRLLDKTNAKHGGAYRLEVWFRTRAISDRVRARFADLLTELELDASKVTTQKHSDKHW